MAEPRPKPSITILYDADEERVRDAALAKGEKFPTLVSYQIETALTKRGYTAKRLAAEATPIKRLVRQIEDDNSDLIFNVCESLGGAGDEERRVASMLELLDKRFTGNSSLALTLATGFNSNVSTEIVSPTGDVIAHCVQDVKGFAKVEVTFDMTGATNGNALYALL